MASPIILEHQVRHISPTASQKAPKRTSVFRCSWCSKVFKRGEHRSRHEMSHTNEKPFSCRFCHKTYARKDLVQRHEKTIHAGAYQQLTARSNKANTGESVVGGPSVDKTLQVPPTMSQSDHTFDAATPFVRDQSSKQSKSISTASPGCDSSLVQVNSPWTTTSDISSQGNTLIHADSVQSNVGTRIASTNLITTPISMPEVGRVTDSTTKLHANAAGRQQDEEQPRKRVRLSKDNGNSQASNHIDCAPLLPSPTTSGYDDSQNLIDPFDIDFMDFSTLIASEFDFSRPVHSSASLPGSQVITNASDALAPWTLALPDDISQATFTHSSELVNDQLERYHLPRILKEKIEPQSRLMVCDDEFEYLCADIQQREGLSDSQLPIRTRRELQHLLNGYFDCFHRHLPFLHLPSLKVAATPSPLIYAICSIGALYRLNRAMAQKLFAISDRMLRAEALKYDQSSQRDQPIGNKQLLPLWIMQARVLLLLYAALGNNTGIFKSELDMIGTFIMDCKLRRILLPKLPLDSMLSWQDWVEIESTKRYLAAAFVCSNLLVSVYDVPPGFGITQDLDYEPLEEERLWSASTAASWQALRSSGAQLSKKTIGNIMSEILTGASSGFEQTPYYVSGFSMLVIIHALNLYAQNLSQFIHFSASGLSGLPHINTESLLSCALASFSRCQSILDNSRRDAVESLWNEPDGPIILNSEAMLRVAYTKLFLHAALPDSIFLFSDCAESSLKSLTRFVSVRQQRGPIITKVMQNMHEAFSVPARAGFLLVQKTAAMSWSIEHAIAGWGCVFFLSHWLHTLEMEAPSDPPSPAEMEIVTQVKATLEGMDFSYDDQTSLAAAVTKSWAPLMNDVWVWGITTRVGHMLLTLGQLYEMNFSTIVRD